MADRLNSNPNWLHRTTVPKITALIHTLNDELRIGRALDSLRACDEVMIVDHGSTDSTEKVANEHGAQFKQGIPGVNRGTYALDAANDWILCLCPNESVSEALEAALFEWKSEDHNDQTGFNLPVRVETESGWENHSPETRLVNRRSVNWTGDMPATSSSFETLSGEVLRFRTP